MVQATSAFLAQYGPGLRSDDTWRMARQEVEPAKVGADDAARLLDALAARRDSWTDHRLFALAAVIYHLGLQLDTALRLRVADLDYTARLVAIQNNPRPMTDELAKILSSWSVRCNSPWLFPKAIDHRDERWRGDSGRRGERPYDLLDAAGRAIGLAPNRPTSEELRKPQCLRSAELVRRPRRRPVTAAHSRGSEIGAVLPDPTLGPMPSDAPPLILAGPARPPVVRGIAMARPLSGNRFDALKAMLDAGCADGRRISTAELIERTGNKHAVRELRWMRSGYPELATLLDFPGGKGLGGYGFNVESKKRGST